MDRLLQGRIAQPLAAAVGRILGNCSLALFLLAANGTKTCGLLQLGQASQLTFWQVWMRARSSSRIHAGTPASFLSPRPLRSGS